MFLISERSPFKERVIAPRESRLLPVDQPRSSEIRRARCEETRYTTFRQRDRMLGRIESRTTESSALMWRAFPLGLAPSQTFNLRRCEYRRYLHGRRRYREFVSARCLRRRSRTFLFALFPPPPHSLQAAVMAFRADYSYRIREFPALDHADLHRIRRIERYDDVARPIDREFTGRG